MVNKAANEFHAAARSLRTTVSPVVGDASPLAVEQLRLIIDMLDFYRQRAHLEHSRKLFEFRCYRSLAQTLVTASGADEHARTRLREIAADVDADTSPNPGYAHLDRAVDHLSEAISTLVAATTTMEGRQAVARTVLAGTRPLLDMQRSWFLPQRVDPDPGTVEPLETFFDLSTAPHHPTARGE